MSRSEAVESVHEAVVAANLPLGCIDLYEGGSPDALDKVLLMFSESRTSYVASAAVLVGLIERSQSSLETFEGLCKTDPAVQPSDRYKPPGQ